MKNALSIGIASLLSAIIAIGLFKYFDKDVQQSGSEFMFPTASFETVSYENEAPPASTFDFTKAAEIGLPAVVHIRSTVVSEGRSQPRDIFEYFFGPDGDPVPREGLGFGSGVLISSDGYIVTNNHVIDDASEINVTLYDNENIEAELIGADPTTDIALIKIDKKNLPYLQFANSSDIKIGEWVAAIGNPAVGSDAFSLKSTVTAGIVSALGRNIGIIAEELRIESFIQTDAVINKGNSGGALVNANGDLVGINTAITTPTGVYAGYGFAVPSNLVKKVVTDLKEYGSVQRALLGITYNDIEQARNATASDDDLGTSEKEGLLIQSVRSESAASKAGLKEGDVIIRVDGKDVTNNENRLQEIIGQKRPGETVEITYKRSGKTQKTKATLLSAEKTEELDNATSVDALGAKFDELDEEQLEEFGIESGVRVREIDRRGMLYQSTYGDARPGFIITNVNGREVSSAATLRNILKQSDGTVRIEGFHEDEPNMRNRYMFQIPE